MDTIITTLLILCVLPLVCAWIAGYHRYTQLGSIDNKEPRTQVLQLKGAGARANAAQANSWEALAVFSAAILALVVAGVELGDVANLTLAYAALRIAYVALYVANIDVLRSVVFLSGYGICMYLFYVALRT